MGTKRTFKGFVPADRITFDLESADGQRTLEVRCKPAVAGSRFIRFMETAQGNDDFGAMARGVREVLDACIENTDEFWAFCDADENGITVETLAEVAGFLGETFAGDRPPEPSAT